MTTRPRRTRPRAVTLSPRRLPAIVAAETEPLDDETRAELEQRPRTRRECVGGPRPCPWAGCRFSLVLDVNPYTGAIKIIHPDLDADSLLDSCALDVADRGPQTLDSIGQLINLSRERVRQLVDDVVTQRPRLRAALKEFQP